MSPLEVVPAVEADVPVLLQLIRELAEYEKLLHMVSATEELLRDSLFGPRPVAQALIARWNGEKVGFALFFDSFSTFLARPGIYLEDLYVKPHVRGKGIGLALMASVARLCVQRGSGRMEWEVLNWNEPSIRFYEQVGAKPGSDWTRYRLTGQALENLAAMDTP